MQQKLAQKEKAAKEEHLRLLAQRARDDRAGIAPVAALPARAAEMGLGGALGGYGSDSDDSSDSDSDDGGRKVAPSTGTRKADVSDDDEDDEDAKAREKVRREKRQERERELRMNNMGNEQRAKMIAKYVGFSWLYLSPSCFRADSLGFPPTGSRTATSQRRSPSDSPSLRRPRRR